MTIKKLNAGLKTFHKENSRPRKLTYLKSLPWFCFQKPKAEKSIGDHGQISWLEPCKVKEILIQEWYFPRLRK